MQCFGSLWRDKESSPSLRKLRKMSIESQFEEMEQHASWQKLFLVLQTKTEKQTMDYTKNEAKKAESKLRNRFRDVLPYDQTRVHLQPCLKNSSEYINASFVKIPNARRSYICSQGPLTSTTGHFWEMIWTQNCPAIVMLNSLIEKGTPSCATYWPQQVDTTLTFADTDQCHEFSVKLVQQTENSVFTTRILKLTRRRKDDGEEIAVGNSVVVEERTVSQFHFTHWPDFGVPQCPDEFLDFLFAVRQQGSFDVRPNQEECDPVVIHCTAGVGRTGTFVLVDVCLTLLSLYRVVDIPTQLLELRTMRMWMVQTAEQLRFCYQAIIRGKTRTSIQTPAVSPSVGRHRPASLQLNDPEAALGSSSSSSLIPLPHDNEISPGSPRRELLRQDGRTPSLDVVEASCQNGKRQKVDGGPASEDINQPSIIPENLLPSSTSPTVESSLSSTDNFLSAFTMSALADLPIPSVNGEGMQLTDQQKRDSELRQKRQERSEQLRRKVEAIKRHQGEIKDSSEKFWKPWMSLAAAAAGAVAIWIAYQRL